MTCFYKDRGYFGGHPAKRNLCGDSGEDKGICSGDSGGGLVIKFQDRFFLYGLASFSNCECKQTTNTCEIFSRGIYVNVAAYLPWIHYNMY